MKSDGKRVKDLLKSIEKIGSDISEKNCLRTQEITEGLRQNKKKYADLLANSYSQAFSDNQ